MEGLSLGKKEKREKKINTVNEENCN